MRLLFDLAEIAEDLFFYGMKPPEIPPRAFHEAQRKAAMRIAPGDDDGFAAGLHDARTAARLDPRNAETRDLMWQSIRLVLMGRRLSRLESAAGRRLGDALNDLAGRVFDAYCSLTPRWLICEWLLGEPPAPPHWEATILQAISLMEAGARIGGEVGADLQAAGAAIVDELLTRA